MKAILVLCMTVFVISTLHMGGHTGGGGVDGFILGNIDPLKRPGLAMKKADKVKRAEPAYRPRPRP